MKLNPYTCPKFVYAKVHWLHIYIIHIYTCPSSLIARYYYSHSDIGNEWGFIGNESDVHINCEKFTMLSLKR